MVYFVRIRWKIDRVITAPLCIIRNSSWRSDRKPIMSFTSLQLLCMRYCTNFERLMHFYVIEIKCQSVVFQALVTSMCMTSILLPDVRHYGRAIWRLQVTLLQLIWCFITHRYRFDFIFIYRLGCNDLTMLREYHNRPPLLPYFDMPISWNSMELCDSPFGGQISCHSTFHGKSVVSWNSMELLI